MKCPICDGELTEKEHKYKLGGKEIGYQSFKCSNCKEDLVFGEEADRVFRDVAKYKKELHYKKKLSYAGNSLVLRIPAKLAKSMDMHKGTTVDIVPGKKEFTVSVK